MFLLVAAVFVFLLVYPQILFAHEVRYKNFTVYSRQPLDQSIYTVCGFGHKVKFVGHKMKFARTISYQPSGCKNVNP